MNLPDYFPANVDARLTGIDVRPVFQDFGRHGHVDVSCEETVTCTPQIQHVNILDQCRLCAQIPAIPLKNKSVSVSFPLHDIINGNIHHRSSQTRHFMRAWKNLHHFISVKKDHEGNWHRRFEAAKKAIDGIGVYIPKHKHKVQTIQSNLPQSVRSLCDQYASLGQCDLQQNFNSKYSSVLSCVKQDSGDTGHIVVHAEGLQLSQLYVTDVSESAPMLKTQSTCHRKVDPVYQIDSSALQENVYICTRHRESCVLFSVLSAPTHREEGFTKLGENNFHRNELPASVCISPFIAAESLVATDAGAVYIWNAGQSPQKVIADRKPRFDCQDSWCQVQYGCHPRQLVVADRTVVELFDHRSSFQRGVDLFALPSKLVPQSERIMATHAHGKQSPYHVAATHHCMFLLDQRFPGTPVMQWYPDLRGPLQYVASTDYDVDSPRISSGVLVASQYPSEAIFYPFDHGNGLPVTMPMNPWRLSEIGDMQHMETSAEHIEPVLLRERFMTSLSGVALLPGEEPGSVWTYQSDAYGEVFYQYYGTPEDIHTSDKTCNLSDSSNKATVPKDVKKHVTMWLSDLQHQVDELRAGWINDHRRDSLQRVKCPADLLQNDDAERRVCLQCSADIATVLDMPNFDVAFCQSCKMLLHLTEDTDSMTTAEERVPQLSTDPRFLDQCAPPLSQYPSDSAHTRVYLSLTKTSEDANFTEQLKLREAERSELKRTLKERQKTVREKRKLQSQADNVDTTRQDSHDAHTEQEQRSNLIEGMLSDLLKSHQHTPTGTAHSTSSHIHKGGKFPRPPRSVSDEASSMLSGASQLLDSEQSDFGHRSDVSSQRNRAEGGTNGFEKEELGLSGFLSLSDDEDFFSFQDVSIFSPLAKANQQSFFASPSQQMPHLKDSLSQRSPYSKGSDSQPTFHRKKVQARGLLSEGIV